MCRINQLIQRAKDLNLIPKDSIRHARKASRLVIDAKSSNDLWKMTGFLAHSIAEGTLTISELKEFVNVPLKEKYP